MGELDLVMQDGATLVFVEVRARSNTRLGTPAESINVRKRDRLRKAARYYLLRNPQHQTRPCRFDVVCVYVPCGKMEWIRDAF